MKYRPVISGPSAPWVDEDDLPDDNGAMTIDRIASILSDRLYQRADVLRQKPDWLLLHEEIRMQFASAMVHNSLADITELNDLFIELMNLTAETSSPKVIPKVPAPLPWDAEDNSSE